MTVNAGGGETKDSVSAWTVDSLNAHYAQVLNERDRRYEQRFVAQEKAVADAFLAAEKAVGAALAAAKEAVNKAESASEKRFESVNEFRAQLADQQVTFLPRNEYNAQHEALEQKVEAAEKALDHKIDSVAKGLAEGIHRNGQLISALGIRIERAEGQRGGLKEGWGFLVGAVGFISALAAIVVALTR